jgi:GNAT superfamily N-acetyltransferase
MSPRVRPARPEDASAAAALMRASIIELCAADHRGDPDRIAGWLANKTPEIVAGWFADPDAVARVAELDGRLAGVVAANRRSGVVLLNYVAPESRFRGVSRALLAAVEDALAAAGHREARLESTVTAEAFYRANGWRDAGAPDPSGPIPGRPMIKALRR